MFQDCKVYKKRMLIDIPVARLHMLKVFEGLWVGSRESPRHWIDQLPLIVTILRLLHLSITFEHKLLHQLEEMKAVGCPAHNWGEPESLLLSRQGGVTKT